MMYPDQHKSLASLDDVLLYELSLHTKDHRRAWGRAWSKAFTIGLIGRILRRKVSANVVEAGREGKLGACHRKRQVRDFVEGAGDV